MFNKDNTYRLDLLYIQILNNNSQFNLKIEDLLWRFVIAVRIHTIVFF